MVDGKLKLKYVLITKKCHKQVTNVRIEGQVQKILISMPVNWFATHYQLLVSADITNLDQ